MKKDKKIYAQEEEVDKMLKDWDVIRCKYCGKKISLLNAISIDDGENFVCEKHRSYD